MKKIRVGIGYDIHPLEEGRRLVLGGVDIPFKQGLGGWSDADVLSHAIIDAMLGAAALGDIGSHFPPGDPEYKDASSLTLLAKVRDIVSREGWLLVNIDATVITEEPKLKNYIEEMRRQLSRTLEIDIEQVSVKASTANKVGSIGRGEGIATQAVVLMEGANG